MPAPEGMPPACYDLMLKCWEKNYTIRENLWFTSFYVMWISFVVYIAGYRMPAPEGTPPACYDLMLKCWEKNPSDRLHFDGILKELKTINKTL